MKRSRGVGVLAVVALLATLALPAAAGGGPGETGRGVFGWWGWLWGWVCDKTGPHLTSLGEANQQPNYEAQGPELLRLGAPRKSTTATPPGSPNDPVLVEDTVGPQLDPWG